MSAVDLVPIGIFLFCISMQINSIRLILERIAVALEKKREEEPE
jgi:hypothetical protein